ncbi:MAG TPA: HD domain-containing protein, partial [Thermodesulfovibrionia bacterium]|nr:HD domain-containing protein [Thermodesulfovibrionia bacterium]
MLKFRDVLKNTTLWHRINFIIDEAQNSWLRFLGKNDFQHSLTVEKILDRLVPETLKKNEDIFDLGEIFLLLVSVYLHDIGRKLPSLHHEIESYKEIKNNYRQFHLLNAFEAEAVAQICAAHAEEKIWSIRKCDNSFGIAALSSSGRTFNLQRLGTLLRIADELDNTYVRVNGLYSEQGSIRNLIRDINPLPNRGVIEIQAQPQTWEDWELIVSVSEYTQKRIREVNKYLQDIGLDYYQVWPKPMDFKAPLSIDITIKKHPDLIESVALLAESRFSKVEILSKLEDCEISVLCKQVDFGGIETITAILIINELNESKALEFRGALTFLRRQHLIHNGIIVTNIETCSEIKEILAKQNFYVFTFNKLLLDLIDFKPLLESYIRYYEQEDIFKRELYIDLFLSLESGESTGKLTEFVYSWISNPSGIQLTILGEYGSGKTTFCERLTYDLTKECLKSPDKNRIPILIKLKDIGSMNSIESAITDFLVNKNGLDINYKTFESLNK